MEGQTPVVKEHSEYKVHKWYKVVIRTQSNKTNLSLTGKEYLLSG